MRIPVEIKLGSWLRETFSFYFGIKEGKLFQNAQGKVWFGITEFMKENAKHFESSSFHGPCLTQCFSENDVLCLPCTGHTLMSLLTSVIDCNGTALDRAWSACFAEFECPTTVLLQVNRKKLPISWKVLLCISWLSNVNTADKVASKLQVLDITRWL